MDWARILAYVPGMVDQELLARNEYLAAENRVLKAQQIGRPRLSDAQVKLRPRQVMQPSAPLRRERWLPGSFPPPLPASSEQSPAPI
jgi:hypothetical protein